MAGGVFAALMLAMAPAGGWARSVDRIDEAEATEYGGATGGDYINLILEDDGSAYLAHVFTNTAASATLTIPSGNTLVAGTGRILVVGGGGAGGGDCGGGGGAGGVVMRDNLTLATGAYTVTVGAGGQPQGRAYAGANGGNTTVSFGGATIYEAVGGGGGSSCTAGYAGGANGGSSGGGANNHDRSTTALQPSNAISPGYGNIGGTHVGYLGGGGGGAGGAGVAATSAKSGNGGDGVASDITGDETYYGGGGGGGGNDSAKTVTSQGLGGLGGGGNGSISGDAYNMSDGHAYGSPGVDGTGGGGGGGGGDTPNANSGAGGSGIVVIRYQLALAKAAKVETIDQATATEMNGATGGDVIRLVRNDDGTMDLVHIFTNTAAEATFRFPAPGVIVAGSGRLLAVGGGGGGGCEAGGGGGAGGVVTNGFEITDATYSIRVGAGGAGGASGNTRNRGRNGGDTAITNTATSAAVALAVGGGGGGTLGATPTAHRPGGDGGSGGGATRGYSSDGASNNTKSIQATAGLPAGLGLGRDGGVGYNSENYGGGGGGALGAGAGDRNGSGGAGIELDITGRPLWYAGGGGGGGVSSTANAAGGVGGGGAGGSRRNVTLAIGADGEAGTGGGGGGGNSGMGTYLGGGGAGGSGVVVIRYTLGGGTVTNSADEAAATLYVFKESGVYSVRGAAKVRVLAVGGGGAGASLRTTANVGSGGGGAGGLVDDIFYLRKGVYTITVGAGGAAGTAGVASIGANGEESSITFNGDYIVQALGGGGGGYNNVGAAGGSGGGGSRNTSLQARNGGVATQTNETLTATVGYGFGGGRGGHANVGGGGGGAGGAGGATAANTGGAGGVGRYSSILGLGEDDEDAWFAGGGGGGTRANTATVQTGGAGGKGGGGTGAGGTSSAPTSATAGVDGTGGGGGGGRYNEAGGAGGKGIVILRIEYEQDEEIERPVAPAAYPYDGETHTVYETQTNLYDIVGVAETNAVGSYSFTVTLKPGLVWSDGTSDSVTINWSIAKQETEARVFLEGWQYGEAAHEPVIMATPATATNTASIAYSSDGGATWGATQPTAVGSYLVRAVIEETEGYSAVTSAPSAFAIWAYAPSTGALDSLGYHADIVVSGYTGATLADFPMLVRLSENSPVGFHYRHALEDGSDLRFTDTAGNVIPHEIDGDWNPDGETLVWLKVPSYANGTVAVMNWGLLDGVEPPDALDPAEVWSDYAGVWHMSDATDSTTNAAAGTVGTAVGATNGVFGTALGATTAGGPFVTAAQHDVLNSLAATGFTASFWLYLDSVSSSDWPFLFGRRQSDGTGPGYAVRIAANSLNGTADNCRLYTAAGFYSQSISGLATGTWIRHDIALSGTTAVWWVNGVRHERAIDQLEDGTLDFFIGGLPGETAVGYLLGALDEFRLKAGVATDDRIAAEYAQGVAAMGGDTSSLAGGAATFGNTMITTNAVFANRWIVEPTPDLDVSPLEWAQGETPVVAFSSGTPLYGSAYYVFASAVSESYTNELPENVGEYEFFARVDAGQDAGGTRGWAALAYGPIAVTVRATSPTIDLGGDADSATLAGRILLANDDDNVAAPVTDQSYWRTNSAEAVYSGAYWLHEGEIDSADRGRLPYASAGETHWLMSSEAQTALCGATNIWYLENVRLGNTYPSSLEMWDTMNFLPESATARAAFDQDLYETTLDADARKRESAHLLLRNVAGAMIVSPCYTNGIGTIYFDAVNGWTSDDETTSSIYQLVVEVATNCVDSTDLPTDENLQRYDTEEIAGVLYTNGVSGLDYERADWRAVEVVALKRDLTEYGDAAFHKAATGTNLVLAVANGGTDGNFYRVYAPALNLRVPARFRIRRVAVGAATADGNAFILVDNVIASFPAMRADLAPTGLFRSELTGSAALGWEGAFETPFPDAAATGLVARAEATFKTNPGDTNADTSVFISSARLHYRWRYLAQAVGDWQTVALDPETLRAPAELDLPSAGAVGGDIEFWFDTKLNAPYYAYVDYSGAGLGLGGFFTEEIAAVTNAAHFALSLDDLEAVEAVTRGTNWYARLRAGASDWEGHRLVVSNAQTGATWTELMTLTSDHAWRGCYPTLTNAVAGLYFRLEGLNRQEHGTREIVSNTTYWVASTGSATMPVSDILVEGGADSWTWIPCDAVTGYLLFQFDDQTHGLSVVHADYQNFNRWDDAMPTDGAFVGAYDESSNPNAAKRSGTSPAKKEYHSVFDAWRDMPVTTGEWRAPSFEDIAHLNGRTAYAAFESDSDQNRDWETGPGMWTARYYASSTANSGVALQMEGCGKGYLRYASDTSAPRGLEKVTFNARLAQSIGADDFAYFDASGKRSLTDYAFVALAAFDQNQARDFTGNAAVSLAARYNDRRGFYEARLEQTGGTATGAAARGQRLSIYKWICSGSGKWTTTLLSTRDNPGSNANFLLPRSASAAHSPLFLAVTNTANGVMIFAGVGSTGVAPGALATSGGDLTLNSYWIVGAHDTASDRLQYGTYGLMTANCPGVLLNPTVFRGTMSLSDLATTLASYTGSNPSWTQQKTLTFRTATPLNSAADWVYEYGRTTTNDMSNTSTQWGLRADTDIEQEVILRAARAGTTAWTNLATVAVSGFGRAGTASAYSIDLHTTQDCTVELRAGGAFGDVRTDVALDTVTLHQWRGDDWDNCAAYIPGWTSAASAAGLTNITFTAAWITNGSVRLSAKRAPTGRTDFSSAHSSSALPSAIRSPLMDGESVDRDGLVTRGLGLGMFSFSYADAQENARLLLQISTNVTAGTLATAMAGYDAAYWTTVTNFDFSAMSAAARAGGRVSCYLGLHGVKGVLRLVVDPDLVEAVADEEDAARFGEVRITSVVCRDEPELDAGSWWGWNLRTWGDAEDTDGRMILGDPSEPGGGLSLALNDAVDVDIDATEADAYPRHKPFVQTPTFTSNVVGEVTFAARKFAYTAAEAARHGTTAAALNARNAQVTLYGAHQGAVSEDDADWGDALAVFVVSNTLYETFTYRTNPGDDYAAFRLAVTGVDGVDAAARGADPVAGTPAVRVLLDEVLVSEAVRARLGFRNVGAFRSDLAGEGVVANVPSATEQPLCDEGWGVQCEVYPAQLANEIDFARGVEVVLHWYEGTSPWGFASWRNLPGAKSAPLAAATGTNLVFRSGYVSAPDAVAGPYSTPGTVVQYSLEARWYQKDGAAATNFLERADWTTPAWYRPLDYNALYGAFTAYTVLDQVAPGWAWVNEANIAGEIDALFTNLEEGDQYIEVAAPAGVSLDGWSVRVLSEGGANTVVTNTIGIFGSDGLAAEKAGPIDSGMTFRLIGGPDTTAAELLSGDGKLDGRWARNAAGIAFRPNDSLDVMYPFGLQLVRANGIVEHEVALVGTNFWGGIEGNTAYLPTNTPAILNSLMPGSAFFYAGADERGAGRSLSATAAQPADASLWTNNWTHTPGRINEGQIIDPLAIPVPNGTSFIVYATLDGDHILQSVDGGPATNATQMAIARKGGDGVSIVYTTDRWYELASVTTLTTNHTAAVTAWATNAPCVYTVAGIGAGGSNSVSVTARAQPDRRLARDFGLTEDNPYTPAVVEWLRTGDFANGDVDALYLADILRTRGDAVVTNLTLTQMYWLDMDPTLPLDGDATGTRNALALRAGVSAAPTPTVRDTDDLIDVYRTADSVTNILLEVLMMVTNRNDGTAWSPARVRGLAPGETSEDYALTGSGNWTSVTFKVEGILLNGLTSWSNTRNWVPLRYFVLHDDSLDAAHRATIEVYDPHTPLSRAHQFGWGRWFEEHPGENTPIFYRWTLDERSSVNAVEVLAPTNLYIRTEN